MYLIKLKYFVFTEKNIDFLTLYYYYRFIVLFKTTTSHNSALCVYKRETHEGESKFFHAHQCECKRDFLEH